jgi:hypothetical protein
MPTYAQIARIFYTQKSITRTIEVVQEVFEVSITQADIEAAIRSQLTREFSEWAEIPWDYRPGLGRRVRHWS